VHLPTKADAPWLLFFPGNSDKLLEEAQSFADGLRRGYDVGIVFYAYRGFDGSGGEREKEAFLGDAAKIYEAVRTSPEVKGKLHLAGFSMGTAIACALIADAQTKPSSVTLLAPLTEIEIGNPSRFSRFLPGDRWETLPYLSHVTVPALVVGSSGDQSLPVAMAHTVRDRLGPNAKYVELPGVSHADVLQDARTWEAMRTVMGLSP
jgi:pimeloyl-ACP methyl ester carboxylesterase